MNFGFRNNPIVTGRRSPDSSSQNRVSLAAYWCLHKCWYSRGNCSWRAKTVSGRCFSNCFKSCGWSSRQTAAIPNSRSLKSVAASASLFAVGSVSPMSYRTYNFRLRVFLGSIQFQVSVARKGWLFFHMLSRDPTLLRNWCVHRCQGFESRNRLQTRFEAGFWLHGKKCATGRLCLHCSIQFSKPQSLQDAVVALSQLRLRLPLARLVLRPASLVG